TSLEESYPARPKHFEDNQSSNKEEYGRSTRDCFTGTEEERHGEDSMMEVSSQEVVADQKLIATNQELLIRRRTKPVVKPKSDTILITPATRDGRFNARRLLVIEEYHTPQSETDGRQEDTSPMEPIAEPTAHDARRSRE
ncbi:unnamed protein product, partial [Heligmosomoides polygyrus]|uniref:KID domain-containing protein n=1 Tax=Heligmosomoides polygyrus TaxID=6339 RepID=A0A183GR39_HELPZ